ncbi:DNA primase [Streptococcus entericus]|uniref:DNA primase n=1 Tax=Streptococcus entericus TaxID=155680 RepID=UPI000368C4A7|nr:DNA primase [Streptococcus entericus]
MVHLLTKEKIADIKASVNIVDVINEVTPLVKQGRQFLGLCPFHKEKTPSFNVLEDKQFYHCFGCGKSGDVFKFLEEYRQISFTEAAHILAERAGIPLVRQQSLPQQQSQHPHQQLYDINRDAAKFYQAVLMTTTQGEAAKAYLAKRGLTDELLTYFGIGLAPDESDYLYQNLSKKHDEKTLSDSGLFNWSEDRAFDAFRDRIMFPLLDDSGRTVGFSGRIWRDNGRADQQAKYKNTRSTPVFNKSYELYHLDKAKSVAKKTGELYLMEGFMDVIAAYRAGVTNAVATMGTALTPEHITHLKPYAKKVILAYDGDKAGQAATDKSLSLLTDVITEIVRLPDQLDPDDFLQKYSEEELARFLTQSRISQVEFYAHYWLPDNLDNLQAQIAYVEQMAQLIAREPSIIAQSSYCQLVADLLPDFDYFMVEQAVNQQRLQQPEPKRSLAKPLPASWQQLPQTSAQKGGLVRAEQQLFYRLLTQHHLLQEFRYNEDFAFVTPALQTLYEHLLAEEVIDSQMLSELSDDSRQAYYDVQAEHFPEVMPEGEIEELLYWRQHYLSQQELAQHQRAVREHSKQGNLLEAEDALAALIAQKRRLE